MSRFKFIPFAVLSLALSLLGCKTKEKPESEQKVTLSAVECGKKGKLLSSSGNACVDSCASGEEKDEVANRCMASHLICGANQTHRTRADGVIYCGQRCPVDSTYDEATNICMCNYNDKPARRNSSKELTCTPEKDPDCKIGEIKVGDKCEKVSGEVCKKLGQVMSNDGLKCLMGCPANQEVDENNQCQMKDGGGSDESVEERLKEFDAGQKITAKVNLQAETMSSGLYADGKVLKRVGGTDAYVNISSLSIEFESELGGGTFAEFASRNAIFAKRSGWMFLRQNRVPVDGKTKVDPLTIKIYLGCLDNKCERLGFKVVDLSSGQETVSYFEK